MDSRFNFIKFSIRGFDITIEDVRDQRQTAPRMVERDDGIGEEEDAIGRGMCCVGRVARFNVRSEGRLKKADRFIAKITNKPADESRHACLWFEVEATHFILKETRWVAFVIGNS